MGQAVSEALPFAIGVAIVPIPIIGVILILFSSRARVNGPLFLTGWVAGLTVAFAAVYAFADAGDVDSDETASDGASWLLVALGVVLLLLAVRSWRKRPKPGEEAALPEWMAGLDTLRPTKACGVGALLAAANPKNLILVVGAATSVAQLGGTTQDAVAALVAFVVVGSLTVATPVVYYLVGGEHAKATLDDTKVWLATHNAAVMTVLFLVFGVIVIANALGPLTD